MTKDARLRAATGSFESWEWKTHCGLFIWLIDFGRFADPKNEEGVVRLNSCYDYSILTQSCYFNGILFYPYTCYISFSVLETSSFSAFPSV